MNALRTSIGAFEGTVRLERVKNGVNDRARVLSSMLQQILGSADNFQDVAEQTANFLIEVLGYDSGVVLQREGGGWQIAARTGDSCTAPGYVLELAEKGQMCFRPATISDPRTVLAIPVLRPDRSVGALVYAERCGVPDSACPVDSLEEALAELLALRLSIALVPRSTGAWIKNSSSALADTTEQEVTVLFCDVRGFSKLAEQSTPQLIGGLISEFFEFAGAEIDACGGRIVDCYGDGLLAMWTPDAEADQGTTSVQGCSSALAIRDGLAELSSRWEIALGEPLRVGISLNTGPALVGNTGHHRHSKYGPFGHTVNLACRVEHAVKYFNVPILMTEATAEQLDDEFATRRLGRVRLAGLSQTVDLHELHSREPASSWRQWSQSYERALALFEAGQWEAVCQVLAPLLSRHDGKRDLACLHLLARAVDCLRFAREPSAWVFEVRD